MKSFNYNYYRKTNGKKIVFIVLAIVVLIGVIVTLVVTNLPGVGNNNNNNNNNNGETQQESKPYLQIQDFPQKKYYVGDHPSWADLKVRYVTAPSVFIVFGPESCTITGFDSSSPVLDQVITITYKGLTTTFTVDIIDPNNPEQPGGSDNPDDNEEQIPDSLLVGATFKTMPKTQYKVGQWLSVKDGVLLLEYANGETRELSMKHDMVHNFTTEKPGKYTLTVIYVENNVRVELTYEITVSE